MHLVRIGNEILNLRYIVRVQPDVPTPGCVRVTTMPGDTFDLAGREAHELRAVLDRLLPPITPRVGDGHAGPC